VSTVDAQAWLRHLLEDVALAPTVDTRVRHDLLADVLAPLGPVEADRAANAIEKHAYWVRVGAHQSSADGLFSGEVDVAAHLAAHALGSEGLR
jgi:hypothetical protein